MVAEPAFYTIPHTFHFRNRRLQFLPAAPLLRLVLREACPIMGFIEREGGCHDGGICGQCVRPEHGDGLPADPVNRPAGGRAPPAEAVSAGSAGGRRLCRCGISARRRFSGRYAGKAGGRRAAGAAGLRRGGKAAPPDAASLCRLLWIRGLCAGPGTAGGQCRPDGERRLLHRCERQGPCDCHRGGLSGADSGIPGGGEARCRRRTGACANLHKWADLGADGPVGQRQRPPGPIRRAAGAGAGAPRFKQCAAGRSPEAADAGGPGRSGGPPGASAPGGTGIASPSGSIPRGWCARRPAADAAHRLDGDRRDTVSRTIRGHFADGIGNRIYGPVGRRGQKGRKS